MKKGRVGTKRRCDRLRPPQVIVSTPLQRELDTRMGFLGQFSAVDQVEIRAQVGGTLTEIHFKDGDIVHKGDLLFVIDPVPYEIKLTQASAQLETASARALGWVGPTILVAVALVVGVVFVLTNVYGDLGF
jgi:multidrug efflux pump subunit AcrA (membrane-fusion protein)